MRAFLIGAASLALSAGAASAQVPGYNYYGATVPLYGYAAPGYGYAATAPLYNYAAPGYGFGAVAPATGGSTIIIVTPGSAYTAPPAVVSGYATQPIYDYTPGYWNRGYWGRWRAGYGWR
jgi:hypothetical protein